MMFTIAEEKKTACEMDIEWEKYVKGFGQNNNNKIIYLPLSIISLYYN